MNTFKQPIKSIFNRGSRLFIAALAIVTVLPQILGVRPALAFSDTYPWSNATTLNQSTYDWGYSTCPTNDTGCMSLTYNLGGTTYGEADPWVYSLRNCTSYVAWEVNTVFNVDISGWHDAADWDTYATGTGHPYTNDSSPQVGDIAQWNATTSNPYGHVAYVWQVNGSTATFAEYNYAGTGAFTSTYTSSTHGSAPDHYIHIGDLNSTSWWASTSGIDATRSTVAAIGHSDGSEDMFTISSSGALQHRYWTPTGGWSSWLNVPAAASPLESISVILNADGHWDVFGLADDGNIYHDVYNSGWSGWSSLSAPSSAIVGFTSKDYPTDNSQYIYATTANGHLWQINGTEGGTWGSWIDRLQPTTPTTVNFVARPTELITSSKHIYIFALGDDGHIWQKDWYQGTWSSFLDRGKYSSNLTNSPTSVVSANGDIGIYAISSSDGHLWERKWVKSTGNWSWADLGQSGTTFIGTPTIALSADDHKDMYATTSDGHILQTDWRASTGWSSWIDRQKPTGLTISDSPDVVLSPNNNQDIYAIGSDNDMKQLAYNASNDTWIWFDRGSF